MNKLNLNKLTTSFQKKIVLILFGIGVFFVLLEIVLQLGGFIFVAVQEYRNRESIRKYGQYRILCLGESTTAFGDKNSYPSQLEEILNQKNIGIKFSVINKGIPGANTGVIMDRVTEFIIAYNPHMIIAMMGINDNDWNLVEVIMPYRELLSCNSPNIFQSFKTYKVIKYLYNNIAAKNLKIHLPTCKKESSINFFADKFNSFFSSEALTRENRAYQKLEEYRKAKKYRQPLESKVPGYDSYLRLGWFYERHVMYTEAVEAFKKAIELDSSLNKAYFALGHTYFYSKNFKEAEKAYTQSIEIDSKGNMAYIELGQCYVAQGKYSQAEAIYKRAIDVNDYDDRGFAALATLYEMIGNRSSAEKYRQISKNIRLHYYVPMTCNNYLKLKEIADKQNIQLVCVQYPMRNIESLKKIFIGKDGMVFVDNDKVFKDALKNASYKDYFTDMFGGDFGHATRKGNRLLANNIAKVILSECLRKY